MMARLTLGRLSTWMVASLVVAFFAGTAAAQSLDSPVGEPVLKTWAKTAAPVAKKPVQPVVTLPTPEPGGWLQTRLPGSEDAPEFSEAQIVTRIARIYGYQSELLQFEADGDDEAAQNLLELAMTEMATLLRTDGIMDRPRFQELYRTILTEYERYFGSSDTLAFQHGDIFQVRVDMFAAMNEVETPLLEDVTLRYTLPEIETTVPMTMNRLVEQSIAYLVRQPDKHLYRWMSRAETYFPMIEQILREEGVPDELKYLAMIESGLVPTARSWAQAAGMWQFISATGRAYGLQVNSWVDERLDPEKATRAAAKHLRDLYVQFGEDWHLALAGYNCSPGRIRRELNRAENRLGRKANFWDIYNHIPRETRNYVPMFIAAALVASNPDAYNLQPVQPGPRYAYDFVPVRGTLDFDTIADLAGTDAPTLRALNPELRRNSTPPSNGDYFVRIPLGSGDAFMERLAKRPPTEIKTAVEYVVRRGDSLGKIAREHNVSVADLTRTNSLRTSSVIHPGQRLVIPVPAYEVPTKVVMVSNAKPVSVQYAERQVRPIMSADTPLRQASTASRADAASVSSTASSSRPTAESTRTQSEPSRTQTRVVYTVRRGDSLTKIGQRYGVTVNQIKGWNNLRSNTIHAGQRLYLYDNGSGAPSNQATVHRVQRGESLSKIASRYGVGVQDLMRWNNLSSSTIVPGQRLTVQQGSGGGSTSSQVVHRVQRGESLGKIASQYGVTVSQIKNLNGLRSNTIHPGQQLKIRS